MSIILAVLLGMSFGFVLQKVGAANPQVIINMLRLKDLHLMKAIFLGIGLSSLGLFALLAVGIIDPSHVNVKASYIGVILGGGILGLGWIISGFCPGTGIVAAGAGRKDALSFILGGLVGAFIIMLLYQYMVDTWLLKDMGGKVSLAATGNDSYPALLPGIPGILTAGPIAIIFLLIAWKLPLQKSSQ